MHEGHTKVEELGRVRERSSFASSEKVKLATSLHYVLKQAAFAAPFPTPAILGKAKPSHYLKTNGI